MAKNNVFEYTKGWFHFELNWSIEEHRPTLLLKFGKLQISLNFSWVQ